MIANEQVILVGTARPIGNGAIANAAGAASVNKDISGAIAIGKNAMNEINGTTGATHTNVIAIGTNAMEKMGLQPNSGNIAIGNRAMQNTAVSNFHPREGNIAIGEDAMSVFTNVGANTKQNVAIGNQAFQTPGNNTDDGGDVVAVGFQAATENCESGCVAIGSLAGKENLNLRSVAIGFQAAEEGNDTGGNTVAIGYNASNGGAGARSIAIGSNANQFNQLGDNSIAIGEEAAGGNIARRNNTIVINALGTDLNSNSDNALHIATRTLGGTGGLIEITDDNGGNVTQSPAGVDAGFSHYLVYNPTTGEIRMCPCT